MDLIRPSQVMWEPRLFPDWLGASRSVAVRGPDGVSAHLFQATLLLRPLRISAVWEVRAPARVVPDTLPKIYVYDHCPFCVRVRLALGLKNIKHEVRGDAHT